MGFLDDLENDVKQAADDVKQAASAVGSALSDAGKGVADAVTSAIDDAAAAIEKELGPGIARDFVADVAKAADYLATAEIEAVTLDVKDLGPLIKKVPWGDVLHAAEAALSVVPVLGTAASDVLATAELLYDVATAKDPLTFAIQQAYSYALATVPAAASLRVILDPTVDAIIRIADGESPTSALLHAIVDEVPGSPKIGDLTPRSVASALVEMVVHKRKLVDVGLDLAAEASGAAGPVAQRCVRAVEQTLKHGMNARDALSVALDIAPVPADVRKAWDDVRDAAKALGSKLLPEDLAALGAFKLVGQVEEAAAKTIGKLAPSVQAQVQRLMKQGRDWSHVLEVGAAVNGLELAAVRAAAVDLPRTQRATLAEVQLAVRGANIPSAQQLQAVELLLAAEPARKLAVKVNLGGLVHPTALDVVETMLEDV